MKSSDEPKGACPHADYFRNCSFEIDPAGKKAYRNDGYVGFSGQRFEKDVNGVNVENLVGL